ncbi:thioesterase II family protein [Gaetbulibacter jejuensis]|uniref:Thioesterase domain-containing protein n=1 Tax=Gaetbulibacter jejuensis TaxID=584607 RepID=A0ABN1JJP5_9FLAO
MSKLKLFCFPFAGGSASYFSSWQKLFDDSIEVHSIELKGRGRRVNETHYTDFDDLVEDVFERIRLKIGASDYALFGHSMGALISFRLYHKIVENELPLPNHLFLSGKAAPQIFREDVKIYHKLDDETFKKEIIELGGTSKVLFENKDLHNLFLPILKNDFRICEENLFDASAKPIDKDITIFVGREDDILSEQVIGWEEQTLRRCNIHVFNGGHFFINNNLDQITQIIKQSLQSKT